MVFVKVRETYDLHTVKNKMTVIGIHTPDPALIKANYPGLLMQCKAYRPASCSVRVACASLEPLDPKGVGLSENDVAPEDVFNPILYKPMSNFGMSQLEARINAMRDTSSASIDVNGKIAQVDVDSVTTQADEFPIYYGLLSNTHEWHHANPQSGFAMSGLRPLVYEMLYNVGDSGSGSNYHAPNDVGSVTTIAGTPIRGNAKPLPFINCLAFSYTASKDGDERSASGYAPSGFGDPVPANCETIVPWINCMVAAVIIPPSRLHELFFRMVCEWDIEFSTIRPIGDITNWGGLGNVGSATHYQNYSYEATKAAITGDPSTLMDKGSCMASSNVEINKVM